MALQFLNNGYFAGKVGIGTDSPGAKLDVSGDVLIDSGEYISWGTVGATSIEGSTASNKLQFRTSSTDRMIINDTGVGIGTDSPDTKLSISDILGISGTGNNTYGQVDLVNTQTGASGDEIGPFITFRGKRGGVDSVVAAYGAIGGVNTGTTGNSTGAITFLTKNVMGAAQDLVEQMRISTGGNVGIGTTSPTAAKLVVDSDTAPQILVKNSDGGNAQILFEDNSGLTQNASITFDQGGDNTLSIATEYDSPNDLNKIKLVPGGEVAMTLSGGDDSTGTNGIITFNGYVGTRQTGTPTYLLGTDASGNVVKTNTVPGSGAGPYLPLSAGSSYPLTGDLYIDTPAGASQSGYALKLKKTSSSSVVQVGAEIFATPWASNTNGGTIIFKNADSATNLQETLRISANGSVGINSTSSSYKLDVGGNSRFQDSVYIDTSTGSGGLYVTRQGNASESVKIYTTDSTSVFETFQDENTGEYGSMAFILDDGAPDPSYVFRYGSIVRFKIEGGTGDVILKDALLSNQKNTNVDTGAEVVALVSTSTYTAAFFDFVVKKGTNVRSGTVYACHNGDTTPLVEFTETSTNDLGDTSDVTLSVDISGTNMRLLATVTSDDWSVKSLIRAI